MKIIEIGGKVYQVVVTADKNGAEIGLWSDGEQLAAICVDDEGVSAHEKGR